ncbi:MAG: ATP-binding cassette domain-containing protein [Velocimicrobium sp.]
MKDDFEEKILLELEDIRLSYSGKAILNHVNLSILSGRLIGMVGDNGLGKSTLLKLMAGIMQAELGLKKVNSSGISYILSVEQLYSWMKVKDALLFYQNFYDDFDLMQAKELLKKYHISEKQRVGKLSKGHGEIVCLILGLSRKVELYLMDESLSGIDPYFKKDIKQFLLENMPENSTLVIATHLLKELEFLLDEIIFVTKEGVFQIETETIRLEYGMSVEQYYLEEVSHE